MPLVLALLFAIAFPSSSKTSWMRPEAFRLAIGMPRAAAMEELARSGWTPKAGRDAHQVVVEYGEEQALTLEFERDRLHSIRFELFTFLPDAEKVFAEQRSYLRKKFGAPSARVQSKTIVLYEHTLPNVMAVLSADANSENGKKGLALLVVRYYDPVAHDGAAR
jgi:hypothetical protein